MLSTPSQRRHWIETHFSTSEIGSFSDLEAMDLIELIEADQVVGLAYVLKGHIYKFLIRPQYRGQGKGQLLAKKLQTKYTHLTLYVRRSNMAARVCYLRSGFREVKSIDHYYQDPSEEGILMRWRIMM